MREAFGAFSIGRASRQLHQFADVMTAARAPEQVEAAMLRAAGAISGACRAELMLDRDQQDNPDPRLIGLWPESAAEMSPEQVEALGYPLCLGLWCGDHYQMTLQLYAKPGTLNGGRWSPRVVRRLKTLCAMAAAAERGLHASQRGRIEAPVDMTVAVRDATFLNAVLPYALSQAQRHKEPLTLFCMELDAMLDLAREHGDETVEGTVGRIADAAARTLRGSDVVAQLDDLRIITVLPNTGGADALTVAGVVRSAVQWACASQTGMADLSVSIGLASFPADGTEMLGLLTAADEAMNRARSRGKNQVATTSAVPPIVPEPRTAGPKPEAPST